MAGRITAPGQRLHSPYVNQLDVAEYISKSRPQIVAFFAFRRQQGGCRAPAQREHEIRIFTLDAKMDHVGSSMSGAWFAPSKPKNRANSLLNQSAAIAPLYPSMQETARERSSDFDEKKVTDSLPPKEFQSPTFVKCTFHKRIACERGLVRIYERTRRCQMAAIRANTSRICANLNQKQRLRSAALGAR